MNDLNLRSLRIAFAVLGPIGWLTVAAAQTYSGGLRGTVTDPAGAALPDISITLTDEATHEVRVGKTDAGGEYVFNALRPSTGSVAGILTVGIVQLRIGMLTLRSDASLRARLHFCSSARMSLGKVFKTFSRFGER